VKKKKKKKKKWREIVEFLSSTIPTFFFSLMPQIISLATTRAPAAVHAVAWLGDPHGAQTHLVAGGGTHVGSGWMQVS
jgi:hypothetical protein